MARIGVQRRERGRQTSQLGTQPEPTEGLAARAIALGPTGLTVGLYAERGRTPEVLVHQSDDGTLTRRWPIPEPPYVNTIGLSGDGSRLAFKDASAHLRVQDTTTGALGPPMEGEETLYRQTLAFTGAADRLANIGRYSSTRGGYLRIRDVATGAITAEVPLETPLELAARGDRIAVATYGALRVFDHDGRELLRTPTYAADAVALSGDGRVVAVAGNAEGLYAWRDGKALIVDAKAHPPIAISADGRWLASGGAENGVRLHDLAGRPVPRVLTGQGAPLRTLAFTPDFVASGAANGTTVLWRLPTLDGVRATRAPLPTVRALLPDATRARVAWVEWSASQVAFTSSEEGKARAWPVDPERWSCDARWSPDGASLVVVTSPRCWFDDESYQREATGAALRVVAVDPLEGPREIAAIDAPVGVGYVALSHDTSALAVTLRDGCVGIWPTHAPGHEPTRRLCGATAIGQVQWSPQGSRLVTLPSDAGDMAVWDTSTGSLLARAPMSGHMPYLAIDPRGEYAAIADWDGAVRVLSLRDGVVQFSADMKAGVSLPPVWDAAGQRLAVGLVTGRLASITLSEETNSLAVLDAFSGRVSAVAWSSDGTRLGASARSGDIAVVDVGSSSVIGRSNTDGAVPFALTWTPTDSALIVGTRGGTMMRIPSQPLRGRDVLLKAAAAATNARACEDRVTSVVWTAPWDARPTIWPIPCAELGRAPVPHVE